MAHGITATDRVLTARNLRAWHNLDDCRDVWSVDEAKDALAWRTALVSLRTIDGQDVPMGFANRREDTGEILACVGRRFRDLQNTDAIEIFRPYVDAGVLTIDTAGTIHGGRRIFVAGRLAIDPLVVGEGDETEIWATLISSHDDTLSPAIYVGGTRTVCHNTVMVTMGTARTVAKVRHSGDVAAKCAEALASVDIVRRGVDHMRQIAGTLVGARVDDETRDDRVLDYLAAVYQEDPDELATTRKANTIADLFDGNAQGAGLATQAGTWWGMYQSLTEYLTHQHGRSADNRWDSTMVGPSAGFIRRGVSVAYVMGAMGGIDVADVMDMSTEKLERLTMEHAGIAV